MTPPAWQSARGSLKCLEREIGRLDYREIGPHELDSGSATVRDETIRG
jgi:hypothetical protein